MAAVDSELRRLAQQRVKEPILAMAQFRAAGPTANRGGTAAGVIYDAVRWIHARRTAQMPNPAYLAITELTLYVFSARFGISVKLIGPTQQWPRSEVIARHSDDNQFCVQLQLEPDKPHEMEAADPGPESATLISLLCRGPD
jgi:hypothetical protein